MDSKRTRQRDTLIAATLISLVQIVSNQCGTNTVTAQIANLQTEVQAIQVSRAEMMPLFVRKTDLKPILNRLDTLNHQVDSLKQVLKAQYLYKEVYTDKTVFRIATENGIPKLIIPINFTNDRRSRE